MFERWKTTWNYVISNYCHVLDRELVIFTLRRVIGCMLVIMMKSIVFVVILRFCSFTFLVVKATYSTSFSSRYCQRNKSYVQSNCQCNTYQQLNCVPPSGCSYHGEGGGYRITNWEGSSRYGGRRGLNIKANRNNALKKLLGTRENNRGLCSTNWDSKCECCCDLINTGEVTVIYTSSDGSTTASKPETKPEPKRKPKPHPKVPTADSDGSKVENSSRIGRVHFIIGGTLLCALGVFLLDQKARHSNWGRRRTAESVENAVRYDNENGPQTHYVIAVV